jgi:hypothetical protein
VLAASASPPTSQDRSAWAAGNEFHLRRRIKAVASAPFPNLQSIAWWPSPSTIASPRKPADGTERSRVERPFSDTHKNIFLARCFSKMKNLNAQLLAMATNMRLDGGHAADRCGSPGSGKSQTYRGFQPHCLMVPDVGETRQPGQNGLSASRSAGQRRGRNSGPQSKARGS